MNPYDLNETAKIMRRHGYFKLHKPKTAYDVSTDRNWVRVSNRNSLNPMEKLSLKKDDNGKIAVDLDGTLAEYSDWEGIEVIGKPIPKMLERVKKWIEEGKTVVIFTARLDNDGAEKYIKEWLEENGIGGLEITNKKTFDIIEYWDDRAIQVVPNTGERVDGKD